jgi:DUF4097 and DUF4098 domain-containing protein YvlB
MASPGMPPVPRSPRSVAGPIVLILLGVLFLMGTMGLLNRYSLAMLFAHYWPALLILWGVIKLIEHEQAKRAGLPGRGIGVGGVFLMIFLICAGLIATGVSRVDWQNLRDHMQIGDEDFDEIFGGGSSFDYSDELSQAFPKGGALHINDDRGTINVNAADGDTLKVSVRKKVRAEKQQDADQSNTRTKPQITVADKIVTLNANTQGAGDKGVSADLDVSVPRNTDLVIVSRRGAVTITGMSGTVEVNHQRGEVKISDQTGNASLTLERSSVRIEHVKGDVSIQGRVNEVAVEDVDGAAHMNGEFWESVRLVHITKNVSFHSSRTDMEFSRLDGQLDLDSGDLRANSLAGPMRLTTRSKDISLTGLSGDLRLQDSNGTVEVGLYKPGNIQIENRRGDIQVSIPPNTAVNVEARTRRGEIQSDFNELKIEGGDRQASASGSIGTNGPRLVINSEHGTIEIRKGSVAAAVPAAPEPPAAPSKPAKSLPAPKRAPVESEN